MVPVSAPNHEPTKILSTSHKVVAFQSLCKIQVLYGPIYLLRLKFDGYKVSLLSLQPSFHRSDGKIPLDRLLTGCGIAKTKKAIHLMKIWEGQAHLYIYSDFPSNDSNAFLKRCIFVLVIAHSQ